MCLNPRASLRIVEVATGQKALRDALLRVPVTTTQREQHQAPKDWVSTLVPTSFLLLLVRHLLLVAMHLFLLASCYYILVRHLLLVAMHLFLLASCYY